MLIGAVSVYVNKFSFIDCPAVLYMLVYSDQVITESLKGNKAVLYYKNMEIVIWHHSSSTFTVINGIAVWEVKQINLLYKHV